MTDPTAKETARALMALVSDINELNEATRRVSAQVYALASRHGVELPAGAETPQAPGKVTISPLNI